MSYIIYGQKTNVAIQNELNTQARLSVIICINVTSNFGHIVRGPDDSNTEELIIIEDSVEEKPDLYLGGFESVGS